MTWLSLLSRHWRAAAIGIISTVVATAFAFCRPSDPPQLSKPLAAVVEHHALATAVDTAAIHQLRLAASVARQSQRRDSVRAARLDSVARVEHERADSLAASAALAKTAADSASAYHAALDERTAEVKTLQASNAAKDRALLFATARGDSLERALTRSETRATRADAVIASAVHEAQQRDACRIAHFFACPSRKAAAVGGAVVATLATVVTIAAAHRGSAQ